MGSCISGSTAPSGVVPPAESDRPPYRCCAPFPKPFFSETPYPELPIVYPDNVVIFPDTVIKGYWVYLPPSTQSFFVVPDPSRLSMEGWFSSICFAVFFWPLSCMPCVLSSCYDGHQVVELASPTAPPHYVL